MTTLPHSTLIARLEQRQAELKQRLSTQTQNSNGTASASAADGTARVADLQLYRDADQSRTSVRVELGRIEAALSRNQRGLFGLCCSCDLDIEPERLAEDPSAAFCEPCFGDVVEDRRRQGYYVR